MNRTIDDICKAHIENPREMIERIEEDTGSLERNNTTSILNLWDVPRRLMKELDRKEIIETAAIKAVDEWDRSDKWSLFLYGPPNTGKSFAAAYWLKQRASKLRSTTAKSKKWIIANGLTMVDRQDLRSLIDQQYLVVDDLGAEYSASSGYFNQLLYQLIATRYDNELKTIFTSNMTGKEIKEHYKDDRLLRRIGKAHGRAVAITQTINEKG